MNASADDQLRRAVERYSGLNQGPEFGYGTVCDYCDSCDYLPHLAKAQGDLKDLQRPWTMKAVLGRLPRGSRLLEVGAGEPLVASALAGLGYDVTIIDPYDGSGFGPTSFEHFVRTYPNVRMIRNVFRPGLADLRGEQFDGVYSVSVLEHITRLGLDDLFAAIDQHLRPGGWSIHCLDCVTLGDGTDFHREQVIMVAEHQCRLAHQAQPSSEMVNDTIDRAHGDLETYYLSASGHNLWRGSAPYKDFPFRRVISVQTAAARVPRAMDDQRP